MIDIVRIFEKYATENDYFFNYGNKYTQNLINWRSDIIIDDDKIIYFLLDRSTYENKINSYGGFEGSTYDGWFWLVVKSDFDMTYFNSLNNESKFTKNIEPLKQVVIDIQSKFSCTDLIINRLKITEVADMLDENCDGIAVNYSIFIPHDYSL